MRLIDADALHKAYMELRNFKQDPQSGDWISLKAVPLTTVIRMLNDAPSIDIVRCGEWIHNPNGIDRDFIWWKCSKCGHVIYSESEHDREEFHAFCGRCGARMKGADDE